MLDSGTPDIQIQTPKLLKNMTCKHACQQKYSLCSKMAAPKPPKNRQKSMPGTPRSPFLCSQVPLKRSMVHQGAKLDATSMPNDTFWEPKLTTTADCKTRDSETAPDTNEPATISTETFFIQQTTG